MPETTSAWCGSLGGGGGGGAWAFGEAVGAAAGGCDLGGALQAGAERRAPADEGNIRLVGAVELRRADVVGQGLVELAHALGHHAAAVLDLLADVADLVVLVAGGGED